ncbi:MAG: hypothetical protein ACJ79H_23200 [Myxococcales bacterium]
MKFAVPVCLVAMVGALAPSRAFGQTSSKFQAKFEVIPVEIDNGAFSVASFWRYGLGCPPGPPGFGCPNPFEQDQQNQGLTLAKSTQSATPGKAVALIKGAKGSFLFELGYDLRKFGDQNSPNGSECTPTSPRWEFQMADGNSYFIPCQLPTADDEVSLYWRRLRWAAAEALPSPTPIYACPMPVGPKSSCNVVISCSDPKGCGLDKRMKDLRIVHDVGPDSDGAAQFGLAVLDNIDVNGRLKGTGPGPRNGDEDEGQGRDKDGREFYHRDSPSHPEQSVFEYHDAAANVNLVGVNGVRGIAYSVGPLGQPCVSFSGDGLVNGKAGYLYSFASCDLSAVGSDLGTYSMTITGPIGTLPYNQTGALSMGYVEIHK